MSSLLEALKHQEERIRALYHDEDMTQEEIAEELGCSPSRISIAMQELNMETRTKGSRKGEKHHKWNGGTREREWIWRKYRKKALERDEYECQRCGMDDEEHQETFNQSLHVHHKTRIGEFEEEEEAHQLPNLVTLCRPCHREVEYRRSKQRS